MINIFEVFLPQLLRYPNPNDPLNGEADDLMMRQPKEYDAKVKEYVKRFEKKEAADEAVDETWFAGLHSGARFFASVSVAYVDQTSSADGNLHRRAHLWWC